jgi:integrase
MTINAFLDQWLEHAVSQNVRPQTARSYADVLDRYIRPGLGPRRIDELTPLAIQKHLRDLSEQVRIKKVKDPVTEEITEVEISLSPRTIRYAHSVLSAALKQAVKWRLLAHNPASHVESPHQPRREMQAMDQQDAAAFLGAIAGTKHEALFALALVTGMRPGEYLGLRWTDVDLTPGAARVSVQRTLVWEGKEWRLDEPKTSPSRRTIPIPDSVVELLCKHRVAQAEQRLQNARSWEDHGFVFTNEIGQPLERHNLLHRHFKPALKRAGLAATLRLYDLRHSAATLLLRAGINPKVASERLGHASVVMTLDTYSHVLPDMQREASDKMEELLFGSK